jgi:hypothetical protein
LDRMRKVSDFVASRNVRRFEFQLKYCINQLMFIIDCLRHVF